MLLNSVRHFLPFISAEDSIFRPYLNSSLLSLAACVIAMVVVSLLTPPPPAEKLVNTTFSIFDWARGKYVEEGQERVPLMRDYRTWLAAVFLIVTVIFVVNS